MKFSMKLILVVSIILNVAAVAYADDTKTATTGEIKTALPCQAKNTDTQDGGKSGRAAKGEKTTYGNAASGN